MKISVVIITFNEASNIAKCLDAAQLVADEIIIVDSFSKDKTKSICKSYNVRFLKENLMVMANKKTGEMHKQLAIISFPSMQTKFFPNR